MTINWKWWKKRLTDAHEKRGFTDIEPHENTELVKEREQDISEPVTSFVKCFTDNPRRFSLTKVPPPTKNVGGINVSVGFYKVTKYTLKDKLTGEEWTITPSSYYHYHYSTTVSDAEWMTHDELNLLVRTVAGHYHERSKRLREIRDEKHKAKVKKERDRLTQIYKENQQ